MGLKGETFHGFLLAHNPPLGDCVYKKNPTEVGQYIG